MTSAANASRISSVSQFGDVLALVPARGGSKSIPHKNIRLVAGKPLLAYSIEQGLASNHITRVIVTTDSEEIAAISRSFGAETPFLRPAELATDTSLDIDFHRHALEWLAANEGYAPRFIVNLRPTHPIRRADTIDRAIETFARHPEADSLRSIRRSEQSPFKMWREGQDGYLVPVAPLDGIAEPYNLPRQILPMVYWQDGYVDVTRPSVVLEQGSTTGRHILPFLIEEECIDIDYEDQIVVAERMLEGNPTAPSAAAPTNRASAGIRNPS